MASLTFVRHGESTGNASGVIQGLGSSPLSERGRRQVAALGERVDADRLALVVSSDMERAVSTAEALDRPFQVDPVWREMDVGGWDGLTNEQIAEEFADELAALAAGEVVPLGRTGETIPQLAERVIGGVEGLLARVGQDDHVVVVCHGGVIETVVGYVLKIAEPHRKVARVTNTALTTVVSDPDRLALARFNDAAHLGPISDWLGTRLREGDLVVGLVRHGESGANADGRWQGQTDSGLSEAGRRQAERLSAWYGTFPTLYSSPLGRAFDTARLLAANGAPETHSGLVELGMGEWEGRTVEEIRAGWPELWIDIYDQGEDLPRGGNGETWSGLLHRVTGAVGELTARHDGGHLGIVSHGAAIRAYVGGILGLDHGNRRRLAAPVNTSVSHVVIDDGRRVLADYNVAPHLE